MFGFGSHSIDVSLERLLPRVHARALGCAIGLTTGAGVFLLTALHVVMLGSRGLPIGLLSQYFPYYDVDWRGAFVGLIWGSAVGFTAGCLLAGVHNATTALWLALARARSDLRLKRNILDQFR